MTTTPTNNIQIPDRLYFRIGDVAELIGVKPYVLRYWESEFPMISPTKSSSGQRVYRKNDVETVIMIKHLLYEQRFSIEGARKKIRELRKEGELKTFKKETSGSNAGVGEDRLKEIRGLAKDIKALSQTSITKLFKL